MTVTMVIIRRARILKKEKGEEIYAPKSGENIWID